MFYAMVKQGTFADLNVTWAEGATKPGLIAAHVIARPHEELLALLPKG
ncbi:MAG: hypothetical protein ACKO2G_05180 [Verrucomicrobiales bacterium]